MPLWTQVRNRKWQAEMEQLLLRLRRIRLTKLK
jgi:hypothetical protein